MFRLLAERELQHLWRQNWSNHVQGRYTGRRRELEKSEKNLPRYENTEYKNSKFCVRENEEGTKRCVNEEEEEEEEPVICYQDPKSNEDPLAWPRNSAPEIRR